METRIVRTDIWDNPSFVDLSVLARLLYLYYRTSSKANKCSIWEHKDRKTCYDLDIPRDEIKKAKKELAECDPPFVLFYNDWIYVPNATRESGYYNGSRTGVGCKKEYDNLPKDVVKSFLKQLNGRYKYDYFTIHFKEFSTPKTYKKMSSELIKDLKKKNGLRV